MNARLYLLLLLLLCSIGATASPDSIRKFEVFVDADPGLGNGTITNVTTQRDSVFQTLTYTSSSSLKPGVHYLYVRTYSDSAGIHGKWGLAQRRAFFIEEKVIAAEYFFDTDPGVGNGTALSVTMPDDSVALTASISTTGLLTGYHKVYVRTKTNSGNWGLVQSHSFFVEESITAGEYFVDTDPGVGLGTAFAFSSPNDTVTQSVTITPSSSLSAGKHLLYIRTKAQGKWSITGKRDFFVLPRINAAEYFFDTDPGVAAGVPLAVSPLSDSVSETYTIGTTGLQGGKHSIYVRSRSAGGQWSITSKRDFYINPKIVAVEYFWDLDPGVGAGISLPLTTQKDSVSENYIVHAPCLTPGDHHLYIRMKDEFGAWGLTQEDTLTFINPTIAATAIYPGPGPYGTPVKVLGSGGAAPYQYKLGSGTATLDSIFLILNNTTATFTATDTCGYFATTNITTPVKPTLIAGGNTGTGSVSLNGYRYWTYVQDANGDIIGAARDNGQNLGTLTMSFLKNNSGTVRLFPTSSQKYLDRNWNISASNAPIDLVGIQLFAVDSEYNTLATADPLLTSKSALKLTKYDGTNEDLDPSNNSGTYLTLLPDSLVNFAGPASSGNGYALAFSVNNFSEFYEARNSTVALPIQNVALKATNRGKEILLQWQTEGEKSVAMHRLMRSKTATDFEEIAQLRPRSGVANNYSFLDKEPFQGTSYYRVMVEGNDGAKHYSQTVSVRMEDGQILSIAPNPANNFIMVNGLEAGQKLSLRDMAGKTLWHGISPTAILNIETENFAAGLYMLSIENDSGKRIVQRVEIVH
ncbi:MAG: T9SS type A sorting domain-containing protein [Chitinophagaceae bacterium]